MSTYFFGWEIIGDWGIIIEWLHTYLGGSEGNITLVVGCMAV